MPAATAMIVLQDGGVFGSVDVVAERGLMERPFSAQSHGFRPLRLSWLAMVR